MCLVTLLLLGAPCGPASVVGPIDKLSVLVTVRFSALVLRESASRRYLVGLALLVCKTV